MNVLDMFKLDGKIALVTGGAGNYGRQMVEALAEAGATVWTASRRLEPNEELAAELRAQGYDVHADAYDQSDEESIKGLLARMIEKHGRVDILVNNSVLRPSKSYHCEPEVFALIVCIGVNIVALCTKLCCKLFVRLKTAGCSPHGSTCLCKSLNHLTAIVTCTTCYEGNFAVKLEHIKYIHRKYLTCSEALLPS